MNYEDDTIVAAPQMGFPAHEEAATMLPVGEERLEARRRVLGGAAQEGQAGDQRHGPQRFEGDRLHRGHLGGHRDERRGRVDDVADSLWSR